VQITGGEKERRHPDYPVEALRQLTRNAVMHRSYEGTNAPARVHWFSDPVEIQSPGGPFGRVSRDNFGLPGVTDYRNPQLAEAMRVLGYVQRFGWGIPAARQELHKNGNPPPRFQVEAEHVLAIVEKRP
jgi:ATP-dependent DNA helicase RecG